MATVTDLRELAEERLSDAEILLQSGRYAGARYLAGYAMECALKHRICSFLGWTVFRTEEHYRLMKSHKFDFLLGFTGKEIEMTKPANAADWSIVVEWTPDMRYDAVQGVSESDANALVAAAKRLLPVLV